MPWELSEGLEEEQGSRVCGCPGRTFCWAGADGMGVNSSGRLLPRQGYAWSPSSFGEQKGPLLESYPCHPLTLRHWAYDLTTLNLSLLSL